jgi:hypothetical protein
MVRTTTQIYFVRNCREPYILLKGKSPVPNLWIVNREAKLPAIASALPTWTDICSCIHAVAASQYGKLEPFDRLMTGFPH